MGSLVTTGRWWARRQIGHLTRQLTSLHNWIPGRRARCAVREMRPRMVHFDLPISLRPLQCYILAPWHFFGGPPLNKRLITPRKLGEWPL
jgi:hypothetical protein